jgi:hypothetical protein
MRGQRLREKVRRLHGHAACRCEVDGCHVLVVSGGDI